jgi:hypothetical protein
MVQRLEQRDGGVYVEFETVSLSRGIPVEVRWLIKPLTDDLPRKLKRNILNAGPSCERDQSRQCAPARACYEVYASCLNMFAIMMQAKAT